MTNDTRKYLTERVLGKCWHESKDGRAVGRVKQSGGITIQTCHKCKAVMSDTFHGVNENRTFTTRDDMMDLYAMMANDVKKWWQFILYFNSKYWDFDGNGETNKLFCLDGTGYESRCELVAEFMREEMDK